MNFDLEKYLENTEKEFALKFKFDFIQRLDEQMNNLRGMYIKNKEQIKAAEAKSLQLAGTLEDRIDKFKTKNKIPEAELEELFCLFGVCREAENFSVMLERLKNREAEIALEGKNYKFEKENLLREIGKVETYVALSSRYSKSPNQKNKEKRKKYLYCWLKMASHNRISIFLKNL